MRRDRTAGKRRIGEAAGDPLDGLVNLFDVGIVLAVAFLIAGLTSTVSRDGELESRADPPAASSASSGNEDQSVPSPSESQAAPTKGRGQAVGTVYRLEDGRLIYTDDPAESTP